MINKQGSACPVFSKLVAAQSGESSIMVANHGLKPGPMYMLAEEVVVL